MGEISFPSPEFKYSGRRYSFAAKLIAEDKSEYSLNTQYVSKFWYSNSLNKLCLEGELEYLDNEGKVINFINSSYVSMLVDIKEFKEESDGELTIPTSKNEWSDSDPEFKHNFIVSSIKITGRKENVIGYKFSLISSKWYSCAQTLDYSNYNISDDMTVFDVLKACIKNQKKLEIDEDSFKKITTNVKLKYITDGNDDLFSASQYLMNTLFYYQEQEKSLKFFFYDEFEDKYKLFDVLKTSKIDTDRNSITLSMDKSDIEHKTYQEPNDLASVVSFPKTDMFKSIYARTIYTYDYSTNCISSYSISSDTIADYFNQNNMKTADGKSKKLCSISIAKDYMSNPLKRNSEWQNDTNIYGEQFSNAVENNALVVNTTAILSRKPSDLVYINLPHSVSDLKDEDEDSYNDWNIRYKELGGIWYTAKVVHIVEPIKRRYRQNLVLFKNFIEDIKEK